MSEIVSRRLVDQRVRNRFMDALSWLSEGEEAVRRMSAQEFFAMFYDWVTYNEWPAIAPRTMTADEIAAVGNVVAVVNAACDDTSDEDNEVINSGWLERISPVARTALELMLVRGCFDEEREEIAPSNRAFEAILRNNCGLG